jgi:hypothetical protein
MNETPVTTEGRFTNVRSVGIRITHRSAVFRQFLTAVALTSVGIMVALCWATYRGHSFEAGIAYLRGSYFYAAPVVTIVGDGSTGQSIAFTNMSTKILHITGCTPGCSCIAVDGLPLELGPREIKTVPIRAASSGTKRIPVQFRTDEPRQRELTMQVIVLAGRL